MRRRAWRLALLAIVLSRTAWAAGRETVIVFDHRDGTISVQKDGTVKAVSDGDRVRVAPGSDVTVVVRSTNTALYTYGIEIDEGEAQEVKALRSFAPVLQSYVPEAVSRRHQLALASEPATPIDALLTEIACALDTLHQVELLALDALVRMSATDSVQAEAAAFARRVQPYLAVGSPAHLVFAASLAAQMQKLNELVLENGTGEEALDPARDLVASTRTLLDQVYAVESLVLAVCEARDTWSQRIGKVTASSERAITLRVQRRVEPIASGFDQRPERRIQVRVEPRWPVRPAVGVALLVSPESEFATYDVDRSVSPPGVLQTGSTDARVTYGLSLALAPARFYGDESGVSFWPLDVTLNPADNVRAFGLGSALSWNIVKLSLGFLWTKHQEAQASGVIESYGRPEFYFGLGLAGWLQ